MHVSPGSPTIVHVLAKGDVVTLIGKAHQGTQKTWQFVRDQAGHEGYVVTDFLDLIADPVPCPQRRPEMPYIPPVKYDKSRERFANVPLFAWAIGASMLIALLLSGLLPALLR